MRIPRGLTVLVVLGCGVGLAWAQEPAKTAPKGATGKTVDLTKIERKILSEPHEYVGKKQQYCLLVFGPAAKFRVWLVHDADILYVNRNGDGHIGNVGERVAGRHNGQFKVGDLREPSGKLKHTSLSVSINTQGEGSLRILIAGKLTQTAEFRWSEDPSDAPIVHLNGPITLKLREPREIVKGIIMTRSLRRGSDFEISGWLGTPGLGSFVRYIPSEVLTQPKLMVEVTFSKKGADAVRAKGTLTTPSWDGELGVDGTVRVPDNAPLGDVDLSFAFPENKGISAPVMRKIRMHDK